jgi:hypothetical protein
MSLYRAEATTGRSIDPLTGAPNLDEGVRIAYERYHRSMKQELVFLQLKALKNLILHHHFPHDEMRQQLKKMQNNLHVAVFFTAELKIIEDQLIDQIKDIVEPLQEVTGGTNVDQHIDYMLSRIDVFCKILAKSLYGEKQPPYQTDSDAVDNSNQGVAKAVAFGITIMFGFIILFILVMLYKLTMG